MRMFDNQENNMDKSVALLKDIELLKSELNDIPKALIKRRRAIELKIKQKEKELKKLR
jgi:hypothetical protein